jgi:hypothetical protein
VQAKGVDQEMVFFIGDAQRDVVVDQLGPTQVRKDAVTRRQLNARLPFGIAVALGANEGVCHLQPLKRI